MFQLDFSDSGARIDIPAVARFASKIRREEIDYVFLTRWEEHCMECAAPDCFKSCTLYQRREDFLCRRFRYGIVKNENYAGLFDFGAELEYARWGKLEAEMIYAPARPELLQKINAYDALLLKIVRPLTRLTNTVNSVRKINPGIVYSKLKKQALLRLLRHSGVRRWDFDEFVLEAVNPSDQAFRLVIEITAAEQIAYRTSVTIERGHNLHRIPLAEMHIDLKRLSVLGSKISIYPEDDFAARLIFTWLNFVKYKETAALTSIREAPDPQRRRDGAISPAQKKIKCVVWDLDNTLWQGTLIEDGKDNIAVKKASVELIKALDRRGIIQTIASKNDHEQAWMELTKAGLDDYFLYPAINWGPKSNNIKEIAAALDIHVDTFAFIDDSPFERAEVNAALPEVRMFSEDDIETLLQRPDFDVPVTEESKKRRAMYRSEVKRKTVAARFDGVSDEFLLSCAMSMTIITPTTEAEVFRGYELIQRTNQLNVSGYRYELDEFRALLARDDIIPLMFSCQDRFGEYGIVGYATVQIGATGALLKDFVMSCRVARKKVECAFFQWLRETLTAGGYGIIDLHFKPTARNGLIKTMLDDIGFQERGTDGDAILLRLEADGAITGSHIVAVNTDRWNKTKQTNL